MKSCNKSIHLTKLAQDCTGRIPVYGFVVVAVVFFLVIFLSFFVFSGRTLLSVLSWP